MKTLLFALLLVPFSLFSQNDPHWTWYSFDAGIERSLYRKSPVYLHHFLKDPSEIADDTPSFRAGGNYSWRRFNSWNFSGSATLRTKKENQYFSFGASYGVYDFQWSNSYINGTSSIVDSFELTFQNSTVPMLIDSLWSDNESLILEQKVISIHSEYTVKTERTRIAASIGGGLRLGITVSPDLRYGRSQSYRYRYTDTNGYELLTPQVQVNSSAPNYDEFVIDSEYKQLESKTSFIVTPYIPLSFEYTPFLHKGWLSKIALEMRGKAGAEIQFVSNAKTYVRPFYSVGLGLKYFV